MFQDEVFLVFTQCSVVVGYRHFRSPCCLPEDGANMHLRKRQYPVTTVHGIATQKTEDAGSKVLQNVGILPQHYTVSQPEDND